MRIERLRLKCINCGQKVPKQKPPFDIRPGFPYRHPNECKHCHKRNATVGFPWCSVYCRALWAAYEAWYGEEVQLDA